MLFISRLPINAEFTAMLGFSAMLGMLTMRWTAMMLLKHGNSLYESLAYRACCSCSKTLSPVEVVPRAAAAYGW